MKLSTRGRYAVMAMADLARHAGTSGSGAHVPLAEIARRQEISLPYLEQLFGKLRRGGLVAATRGPGGGYRLAQPAAEMRIADIIIAIVPSRHLPLTSSLCQSSTSYNATARTPAAAYSAMVPQFRKNKVK